tara:strand:- start:2263 stop:2487 length:225 start_codon:yes stop_codon:yes gene_type:complete
MSYALYGLVAAGVSAVLWRVFGRPRNTMRGLWEEDALRDEPVRASPLDGRAPTLRLQITSDTHLEFFRFVFFEK